MSQTYGYIWIATREQNEDRQLIALSACEIPQSNLFTDKQSGKNFDKRAYKRLVKNWSQVVKSIDRIGRNTDVGLSVRYGMALGTIYRKLREQGIALPRKYKVRVWYDSDPFGLQYPGIVF